MARTVVCVSHATGAGGEEIARAVAERLGFRYVDHEVVTEAAEWGRLDPALVADAERRKPLGERLLSGLALVGGEYTTAADWAGAVPADADVRSLITDALASFADQGSVVIVAHAASFALADRAVLRVLITASPDVRARRLAEAGGGAEADAARRIRDEDRARADYLRRFYGVKEELASHFDVVVNTDVLTPAEATDLIASAAG